ncbi:hypothetical protein LguiB_004195 [Lonicera macranthoides]
MKNSKDIVAGSLFCLADWLTYKQQTIHLISLPLPQFPIQKTSSTLPKLSVLPMLELPFPKVWLSIPPERVPTPELPIAGFLSGKEIAGAGLILPSLLLKVQYFVEKERLCSPFAPQMEHICGRPLGLQFDKKARELHIADSYLGLHVVGPAGGLATPLVTKIEGRPLPFTNDMDIDEDEDNIYLIQVRSFREGNLFKYKLKNSRLLYSGIELSLEVLPKRNYNWIL